MIAAPLGNGAQTKEAASAAAESMQLNFSGMQP